MFVIPSSNVRVTATFVAMYDFMIYVERTTYDNKTYTGYYSSSYMNIGRTQGSFSGAYLWDNATYTIPGEAFYTLQDWAPNPWLYINMDVSSTTTMPSGVRIDIQRVDTGKTITLNASTGSHTFTTSKDEGAEGFYLTQADVGKWIPYKVTRGMYRI